jgi:glutathione S-transferase
MIDFANMALRNSPSSNRFVTNTMCPFAQKVHLALEASETPYEMEEISLYGSNGKPDWFLKLNPKGTVPVLVSHGGAAVYPDSDVVVDQYEAGNLQGNTPIYPPEDRTDVRERIAIWRKRINAMLPDGKAAVLGGQLTPALAHHLTVLNEAVEGPYLASQRVTTADCHAFPFLWRLSQEYPSAFAKDYSALEDWLDLCAEQTAFRRTIQPSWGWWW